jgi:hypothetical protein
MHTIQLHLERLRRHYEVAVRTYDAVSLLDLSHSLRVWAELKMALPKIAPAFGRTLAFKTATPTKKTMLVSRGKKFVFAYMPGGVITFASNGELASVPWGGPGSTCSLSSTIKKNFDGSMELKNYCVVSTVLEQTMINKLQIDVQTRCNFPQWMGAEAVRLSYPSESGALKTIAISREMIIKRVANTMDGSHPSAACLSADGDNRFDEAVHHLLQFQMGGLPLPHFILLKIAQDILSTAPKLLSNGSAEDAANL